MGEELGAERSTVPFEDAPPGAREAPVKRVGDLFSDPVAWLTPLSTDDRGKPAAGVDDGPADSDEPRESAGGHPPLGRKPVDDGAGDPDTDPGADADTEGDTEGDLARTALASAQGIARPRRRTNREVARRTRRENLAGRNTGGYSGPGRDLARDPQRIGPLLAGYLDERGWDRPLAEARVFAEWSALVGADVATHCAPQSLNKGELRIAAESTAWATQLRLLSGTLLARLVAELGPQVVTKLVITGPVGPSWKHGAWSFRGGRGPRDTYG
jgi:predicted nucleic acid-binding Zn ribbon protein